MCMLLMGCGSAGGFNTLSLNPTLLALPENSFSRTGGQFTAASSQYLSVNNNTLLKPNGSDMAFAFWYKMDSTSTNSPIVGRWGASSNTDYLLSVSESGFARWRWGGTLLSTAIATLGTDTTGVWHFGFAWYDSDSDKIYYQFNGGTVYSAAVVSPPSGNTNNFIIGRNEQVATGPTWFLNGSLDNVLAFQPPTPLGDGTSGSLAHTIATTLYNSGNGLAFQDITSTQETDWGIVSGWLDNSLTADAFGSNTLTNNNGVTQAAGKVNAVAVNNDPAYFINDASANNNDLTQVTLASRPIYKSAGYWTFDGSDDWISKSGISFTASYTLIAVVKCSDDTGTENFLDADEGGGGHRQFQFRWNGTTLELVAFNNVPATTTVQKTGQTPSNWNICVARVDGTSVNVFCNGGTAATGTITGTPNSGTGTLTLGRYGVGNYLNGDQAHVIVIPSAVTDAQLNSYGNYLVSKYPSLSLSWTDI